MSISIHPADISTALSLPFILSVRCGFPNPAEDFMDLAIDLNKELVTCPEATFYARVRGNSMSEANLADGDVLVIDRSKKAESGDIVLGCLDGEFTVKRMQKTASGCLLVPENPQYSPIKIGPESDFRVWGVVTYVIKKAR